MRSKALPIGLWVISTVILAWPVLSPDTWWHLAGGRDILRSGIIPRFDSWSFTRGGQAWIDFEWLAQTVMYALHSLGGFHLLIWAKALAGAAAVAATYKTATKEGAPQAAAVLAAAAALTLVRTRAFARPEIFSLWFFAVFLYWALRARRRLQPATWPSLVALTALWANVHGAFILGPGILGLLGLGLFAQGQRRKAQAFGLAAIAAAAAALLNPYGIGVYTILLEHIRTMGTAGAGIIAEWRPLRFGEYPVYWLLLVGVFIDLARRNIKREADARMWTALLVPLGLWSSSTVRTPVYFVLAAAPYVAARLSLLRGRRSHLAQRTCWGLTALAGLLLLQPLTHRDFSSALRTERLPSHTAKILKQNLSGPLFNDCGLGGWLAWQGIASFCDSRYLFLPEMTKWRTATRDPAAFQALMDRHDIEKILVRHPQGMVEVAGMPRSLWAVLLDKQQWALVASDDATQLFFRRQRPGTAELELRYANPADPIFVLSQVRAGRWSKTQVQEELQRLEVGSGLRQALEMRLNTL
jgi:hypothetical protein